MDSVKKLLLIFFLSMCLTLSFSYVSKAQYLIDYVTEPGDITLSGGLSSGSNVGFMEDSEIGLTLQLFYGITEEIRGGIDYTYYFIGERQLSANELNFNAHYFFRNRDNVIVYALGGINISRVDGDEERWGVNVDSRNFGLNAGVGLEIEVGNISLFGEPKFTLGGWNQFLLTAGVRYRL